MALREIQRRHIGTIGGLFWSVIHPLMIILVYWFVFSVGFKVRPAGNMPFIAVFLCGLIPWMMFAEALTTGTSAVTANISLVKKTDFPTEILPVAYLVAGLITHAIMLVILVLVLFVNKINLSLYNLQFLYYLAALTFFCLGLSWFLAAVNVFCRDVGQVLTVILNVWFWFTPIVWSIDIIPSKYHYIVKLNPFYYIVQGYKTSFLYHRPLWNDYPAALYFWLVCTVVFIVGAMTFKKLKSEFAEVL